MDEPIRTQAGIIGAGPAGLFLSHLLKAQRTESVVLEARSRPYVEGRVRAGVLEPGTVGTMARLGLDSRLRREGLIDEGLDMRFRGRTIHLNLPGLTGKSVMIYGQQEVVKDLIAARLEAGDPLIFEAQVTRIEGIEGERPRLHYTQNGEERVLDCDFVAGCDGYHGVGRTAMPQDRMTQCEQSYGFAWLGVLARARPMADMTYSNSDRGFALCSRRSMQVSRLYLQVPAETNPEDWSNDRFLHNEMIRDVLTALHSEGQTGARWLYAPFRWRMFERIGQTGREPIWVPWDPAPGLEAFRVTGMLGVHADEYETAAIMRYHPETVDYDALRGLEPTNLTLADLQEWRKGGASARRITSDGYFGAPNPVDPDLWRHYDETARLMAAAIVSERMAAGGHISGPGS
ncbi:FAD-dependent monooxygenase [Roseomonas chloroacetimidivorans]|uniref:FAD-dependent monooxygenase n=1 Tax=Roseomonas chloroacetimidivorans TaxID=1766656 RepID=UPI003C748808